MDPTAARPRSWTSLRRLLRPGLVTPLALSCAACLDWQLPDPNPTNARSYYMAETGSDETGDGSKDRPWATIAHADQVMIVDPNGVVVHVQPGTYRFGDFTTSKSGTAPGTIRFVSEVPRRALLLGSQWRIKGAYTSIEGFDFDGAADFAVKAETEANHNQVKDNRIRNTCNRSCCAGAAITVGYGSSVMNNIVEQVGPARPMSPPNAPCDDRDVQGIQAEKPGVTIQNNIISDVSGWGILLWGTNCRDVVSNNTIDGGHSGAIYLVANGADDECPINDYNTVINNIARNGPGILFANGGIGGHNLVSNNLLYNITGEAYVDGNGVLHPLHPFTDPAQAVDNGTDECAIGTSTCVPATDIEGKVRPQGVGYDIGAHEDGK